MHGLIFETSIWLLAGSTRLWNSSYCNCSESLVIKRDDTKSSTFGTCALTRMQIKSRFPWIRATQSIFEGVCDQLERRRWLVQFNKLYLPGVHMTAATQYLQKKQYESTSSVCSHTQFRTNSESNYSVGGGTLFSVFRAPHGIQTKKRTNNCNKNLLAASTVRLVRTMSHRQEKRDQVPKYAGPTKKTTLVGSSES